MGQGLSEPKTEKDTTNYESPYFAVSCSGMQGWRAEMEDAFSVQLPLDPREPKSAYFAVFDGHGSRLFSTHCGKELHKVIMKNQDFCKKRYEDGLKQSFHYLDHKMEHDDTQQFQYERGGTTAIVVIIKDNHIICANAGDSRAIACVNGRMLELSHDHKPNLPTEESRIYRAGGWVEFNRVNGNLALSRAFGDFEFKQNRLLPPQAQIVTVHPDIKMIPISDDQEFIVIACDGIWDVMNNEEVVEFIRNRISLKMEPSQICEALLDHCLAPDCRMGGIGCDNMTVILVCFLHGGTYTQFIERCSHQGNRQRRRDSKVEHSSSPPPPPPPPTGILRSSEQPDGSEQLGDGDDGDDGGDGDDGSIGTTL